LRRIKPPMAAAIPHEKKNGAEEQAKRSITVG
jgi:hypothetical protein